MYFENNDYHISLVEDNDLIRVVELYNSNKNFLINHLDRDSITLDWLKSELNIMKEENFYSCKVVKKSTDSIVGIIDFKIDKESYLSLLMISGNSKGRGVGREVFNLLEDYIRTNNSSSIRIDVVTNYDDNVLKFWNKNGFKKYKNITLSWNEKELPALIMKKILD